MKLPQSSSQCGKLGTCPFELKLLPDTNVYKAHRPSQIQHSSHNPFLTFIIYWHGAEIPLEMHCEWKSWDWVEKKPWRPGMLYIHQEICRPDRPIVIQIWPIIIKSVCVQAIPRKERAVTQIQPQQPDGMASINVSRQTDSSTPLFPWSVYRSP